MSDQLDEIAELLETEMADQEVILEIPLSKLTPEVECLAEEAESDSPIPTMKSEIAGMCDAILEAVKYPEGDNIRAVSPGKSTKRKRKNRRRREKKAALLAAGLSCGQNDSEVGTGTETEFSQNSEDFGKGEESGETGTDGEMEQEIIHVPVVDTETYVEAELLRPKAPAVANPEPEKSTKFPDEEVKVDNIRMSTENSEIQQEQDNEESTLPTHSVQGLLQIAKNRILNNVFAALADDECAEGEIIWPTPAEFAVSNVDQKDSCIVPTMVPTSCSSPSIEKLETVDSVDPVTIQCKPAEQQKSSTKTVHFDEGPPEILPVEVDSGSLQGITLSSPPLQYSDILNLDEPKEAIILIDTVAATDSVTSSVVSVESAGSLLKGSGGSEDVTESTTAHHYPSRETVEDDISLEDSSINVASGPVQILTLHFTTEAAASSSVQETNLEGGDEPYLPSFNNNNELPQEHEVISSGQSSPPDKKDNRERYFIDTETESDCPWLPERVESLTKVISAKEKSEDSANGNKDLAEAGASGRKLEKEKRLSLKRSKASAGRTQSGDNLDGSEQGCNCAKMCVVM